MNREGIRPRCTISANKKNAYFRSFPGTQKHAISLKLIKLLQKLLHNHPPAQSAQCGLCIL